MALIPAVWFTADRVVDNYSAASDASTDLPIPSVSSSTSAPTESTTPTPSVTPQPSATPASAKLADIEADSPRRIVSGSLIDAGFDSAVTSLEPASTSEVARWEPRGSPGSPGTDTVYVIGKVEADSTTAAFAQLPALKPGAPVSIRTDRGTMTYTVTATALKPESAVPADPLFTEHVRGRLVLLGIRYAASGDRLDSALVVTAQLSGAEPS